MLLYVLIFPRHQYADIQFVLADEKGTDPTLSGKTDVYGSHNGSRLRGKLNKVVLAYSGGLDTSVIVPWLRYRSWFA